MQKKRMPNRLPENVRGQVAEIPGIDEQVLKESAPAANS